MWWLFICLEMGALTMLYRLVTNSCTQVISHPSLLSSWNYRYITMPSFLCIFVIVFKNVFWYYIWEYLICKYESNLEAGMLLNFSMQIICPELFTIPIGDTISNEIKNQFKRNCCIFRYTYFDQKRYGMSGDIV